MKRIVGIILILTLFSVNLVFAELPATNGSSSNNTPKVYSPSPVNVVANSEDVLRSGEKSMFIFWTSIIIAVILLLIVVVLVFYLVRKNKSLEKYDFGSLGKTSEN